MKDWSVFAEIQSLKKLGLNKSQVTRKLKINYKTVNKYWHMDTNDFAEAIKIAKVRKKKYDEYKEDIVYWLLESPHLSSAQIYHWLKEKYPDFKGKDRTLRKYIQGIRVEYYILKKGHHASDETSQEIPPICLI